MLPVRGNCSCITRKMVPITGRAGLFLEFFKLQSKSKLNPNQIQSIFCSSFFLCLKGQSELCGSYHFSSLAFLISSVELFGSYHLLQSCFLSSSIYMAKLSRLVAATFSSLVLLSSSVSMANLKCLLLTTFSSFSFSPTHFHHLASRVARRCFSWSSVSDDLFYFSCNFFVILLVLSFLHPILSLSILCSSVSEALFALSFPFLSEHFFLVHTKVALAYSRNE